MTEMTDDLCIAADTYGYRFDIGGIGPDEKKALNRAVKRGTVAKVRAAWPWLISGTCMKTCYINLGPPASHKPSS